MDGNVTSHIVFATVGFVLGYFIFDLLMPGEMVLHRMAGALIIGIVGAVLGSMAVDVIFDQQRSQRLRNGKASG